MNDREVIAILVKQRERCRQLVQLYQVLRLHPAGGGSPALDREALTAANRILTQVLSHLRELPAKPAASMEADSDRQNAALLLREIGDLLERAIVADREIRQAAPIPPAPPTGAAKGKAMRLYAQT